MTKSSGSGKDKSPADAGKIRQVPGAVGKSPKSDMSSMYKAMQQRHSTKKLTFDDLDGDGAKGKGPAVVNRAEEGQGAAVVKRAEEVKEPSVVKPAKKGQGPAVLKQAKEAQGPAVVKRAEEVMGPSVVKAAEEGEPKAKKSKKAETVDDADENLRSCPCVIL